MFLLRHESKTRHEFAEAGRFVPSGQVNRPNLSRNSVLSNACYRGPLPQQHQLNGPGGVLSRNNSKGQMVDLRKEQEEGTQHV